MAEILLPPIVERPVELEPRTLKGGQPPADVTTLADRISLGEPFVFPLTADATDKDTTLSAFIKTNPGDYKFNLVRLGCTLHVVDGEPFKWATVGIVMERTDDPDAKPAPVAWSLQPDSLSIPVTYSQKVDVGASLSIAPFWKFSVTPEVAASYSQSDVYLQAVGLQESTPKWEFTQTSRVALNGSYPLLAVIVSPRDVPIACEIQFDAEIQRKKFGLIRYGARIPSVVSTFVIK